MNISRGKIKKAQKVVIYGVPGIGKTTLASQFPDPLFIDTEGSTNNLDVSRTDRPTSYSMFLSQLTYIKNNPSICKTLIIDTIDWTFRLLVDHVCMAHNKKGIEDFGYGQGYSYVKEELGKMLNLLTEILEKNINVVLLAHAQVVKFELPEESGAYDKYQLKLIGKGDKRSADLILEWADMVLFCNYKTLVNSTDAKGNKNKAQGNRRVMYTTYNPVWEAKNRHNLRDELNLNYEEIKHIFEDNSISDSVNVNNNVTATTQQVVHGNTTQQTIQQNNNIINNDVLVSNTTQQGMITKPNYIPQALWDLMQADGIFEYEILEALYKKKVYPRGTEFDKLDTNLVNGALISQWEKIKQFILSEVRETSF